MKLSISLIIGMSGCMAALANEPSAPPSLNPVETAALQSDTSSEVGTLLMSGRDCLSSGKWMEAAALLEKARSLQPANNEVAFVLSAAYIELKRYADALPMLESLAKGVPDSPMVKNNLAWVLLHVKDTGGTNMTRAVKLARAAVLDVPSDYAIWNTLGEAYYATGRYDKALQAAESGLRLSVLAGITNSPCRELLVRSRKAAGAAGLDEMNSDRP